MMKLKVRVSFVFPFMLLLALAHCRINDRWWKRKTFLNRYSHPTHMIVAPKTIRPSTVYRVVVSIFHLDHPVDVRASIQRDGVEIASAKKEILKGYPESLLLQIPRTSVQGYYRLRVEGNLPGTIGGTIFSNDTDLFFSARFLTVLIQTNRPVYTGEQMVRFRILFLTTHLKPYDEPVDVYVLDSDGYVMRRWPSRPTNVGVISMSFKLPFLPKTGWWKIRAVVNGQIEEKEIKVEKWYTPRFETKVFMKRYFLESDPAISGRIEGEFTNDMGVYGRCTVRLYGRTNGRSDWNLISTEYVEQFYAEQYFNFSMFEVSRIYPRLDGVNIRVEAEVMDTYLRINHTGFSHAKLINSSVSCRFIGSPPFIFKPGMPFHGTVAVSYHDLQPLDREKLARSRLVIRADAQGGTSRIPPIIVPKYTDEEELNRQIEEALRRKKEHLQYYSYYGYHQDVEYLATDSDYYGLNPLFNSMNISALAQERLALLLNRTQFEDYREKGVFEFKVHVPSGTTSLVLSASYSDEDGDIAGTTVPVLQFYSSKQQYIGIETTTERASVGGYVVFNIRTNFKLPSFHYMILAKDMITYAALEVIDIASQGSVKTISVPVSSEMAPSFTIVVYHITSNNEIIADSLTMPVDSISNHKVRLLINMDKDHTLRTVEFGTFAAAGSFYGISGVRNYTYALQGGNELSYSSVMEALHSFTNHTKPVHRMQWRSREGLNPDEAKYFITPNYGPDANRTFNFSGLVVFTDARVGVMPQFEHNFCNESEGYSYCLVAGCYPTYKKCDGVKDCNFGYDEADCDKSDEDRLNNYFRLHQFSRFFELYDVRDGDWLWIDQNIGHKSYEMNTIKLPNVDDPYIVNAFAMSRQYGFGLIEAPQQFLSLPPIYIKTEMPDKCRRGETVGLRVIVYNTTPREYMIMVIVHGSDKHRMVKVGLKGVVDYYKPEVLAGDAQHLLSVNPRDTVEVVFPVAPAIDQGELEIKVTALTQIGRDEATVKLEVEPEGATISRHTSTLLDLKNRALVYEYLDIIVEESFVIPLQIMRWFVAGSPRGHVSLCGDIVGPIFPNDKPVDHEQSLRKILRGTEASTFNFGANLWSLHYLRLTNQLDYSKAMPIFEQLNVELAAVMYRFDKDGAFRMWDMSTPSVWLTALTTRTLQQAQFQDWENYIYIEPYILTQAVSWLLQYQTALGSFTETPEYGHTPLDQKMKFVSPFFEREGARNISLTAHVLITLEQCINSLQGDTRTHANNAKFKAMGYLERHLNRISDSYEVAIVAYALSLSNSGEKEVAFGLLSQKRREEDGLIYWSRKRILTNERIRENNQRSLLQPKFEDEYDSHAVEATSYALLVYLIREGVTMDQDRIVRWLNGMRMHDGGFISTVDTLIAMQALIEYSYRARLRDITDMRVEVEATGEPGRAPHMVLINGTNLSTMQKIPVRNVWGLVNIIARGAGQAILQLDVSYGVDRHQLRKLPPIEAFDMTVRERFSVFGNKSIGHIEVCAQWINYNEADQSSAAVIEIENPTGYVAFQLDAEEAIRMAHNLRQGAKGYFPSLKDVVGGHGDFHTYKTVWLFDYIPGNESWCFEYKIRRWYPVANMTRVRMATVYELYQPERFQMVMFNSSTYSLDVCEVCASYQCPYCPIYSTAYELMAWGPFVLLPLLAMMAFQVDMLAYLKLPLLGFVI